MKFRYYFFKENTRDYDNSRLVDYFTSNPYFTKSPSNDGISFLYYNLDIEFKALFCLANKSKLRNFSRIDPKYLDTNIYVELDGYLPTFNCSLILDICDDLCKLFGFKIYNEYLKEVIPFRKSILLNVYNISKSAYKQAYPEVINNFYKCEQSQLDYVYSYLLEKSILNDLLSIEDISIPNIKFYSITGKRKVYTSIDISITKPFLLPAFVDMIHVIDDKCQCFISLDEFLAKAKNFFQPINSNVNNLYYINKKHIKKIAKIIAKTSFSPLVLELKEVKFRQVLDI